MREISEIQFTTDQETENRQLIDQYVLDAVDRLPGEEFCSYAAFMPVSEDKIESNHVWLMVAGDVDAIVDHESETWETLVADGFVTEWVVTGVTDDWYRKAGEQGGELLLRLHRIANQATRAAFQEFETAPAAIDAYPGEGSKHPIGWWMLLHALAGHQEYTPDETVDLFLHGLKQACKDLDKFESSRDAQRRIDDCIHALETLQNEIGA